MGLEIENRPFTAQPDACFASECAKNERRWALEKQFINLNLPKTQKFLHFAV